MTSFETGPESIGERRTLWERQLFCALNEDDALELEMSSEIRMPFLGQLYEYIVGYRVLESDDSVATYFMVTRTDMEQGRATSYATNLKFVLVTNRKEEDGLRWQDEIGRVSQVLDYIEARHVS
jgi:hypothetical protein